MYHDPFHLQVGHIEDILSTKNIHSIGQGMEQGTPISKLMHHWDVKSPTKHPEHLLLDACQGLQQGVLFAGARFSDNLNVGKKWQQGRSGSRLAAHGQSVLSNYGWMVLLRYNY
jgi:hypothetical protein